MLELLVVLGIYLVVSFIGMAALWTVAARKGVVRAPSYFFWLQVDETRMLPAINEGDSSIAFLNFQPLGLTTATVVLLSVMSTSQLVPENGLGGSPNQVVLSNVLICS